MIRRLPAASYRQIADQNWMEAWKQHYKPIQVGERLVVLPAWMDSPHPNRVAIRIDPGMAFGTGTHPTTQLCLELMEKRFAMSHPVRVIDVGCGSGILSIAAIKLGAESALGVDIDAGSIANARENANINHVGEELILGGGSVREILDGRFAFRRAPLVLANILAPVIVRLFDAGLAMLVDEGGAMILSGILQEQSQNIIDAAQAKGLTVVERRQMGDWVAFTVS
jgi:ribosomal protein L11 methyltransferase